VRYAPLVPVPELGAGAVCAEDVHAPLLAWMAACVAHGGRLRANSLTRTVAQQQVLRDRYVAWLNANKPAPEVAVANKPGRSNHQGGRAIDVATGGAFPAAPPDQQVDLLWATGQPLGWTPIIAQPDENMSEHWHFDFWGFWRSVRDHRGYDVGCLCSALDVGQAGEWQSDERLVQALLLRAGYDIGDVDGILGARSQAAIVMVTGARAGSSLLPVIEALRLRPVASAWQTVHP